MRKKENSIYRYSLILLIDGLTTVPLQQADKTLENMSYSQMCFHSDIENRKDILRFWKSYQIMIYENDPEYFPLHS